MDLDRLIARLQELRADPGVELTPDKAGVLKVFVTCQVPYVDGWLVPQNIRVGSGVDGRLLVRIEGGFGA